MLLEAVVQRAGSVQATAESPRVAYQVFEALRVLVDERGAKSVWDEVLDLHELVIGWFQDLGLYHRIGWLVAVGVPFPRLVSLAGGLTRSVFAAELDRLIRDALDLSLEDVQELNYQNERKRRRAEHLLLLANVESIRRQEYSAERYPFHAHKSIRWSLEHIHAQNAEALNTEEQWAAWLALHGRALETLTGLDDVREAERRELLDEWHRMRKPVERAAFRRLAPRISAFLSSGAQENEAEGEWMHSIGNLALLSGGDNAALSNAAFEVKRQRILELDRQGQYIPVCTRQVFLKYFTDADAQQVHFWSPRDRENYVRALEGIVRAYLKNEE